MTEKGAGTATTAGTKKSDEAPCLDEAQPGCKRGRPRSEAVQENVLRAANQLLDERGFKAMTIEAIAERAGASKVTLYRWWPNKAAIVMEAFLAAYPPSVPHHRSGSAIDGLREQMVAFVTALTGRPGVLLAGLAAEGVLDAEVGDAFRTRWVLPRRVEAAKVLQHGIDAGELRGDLDIELALDALYGPMYYRLLIKHAPLTRAFALALWESVTRGIAAPHEARGSAGAARTRK